MEPLLTNNLLVVIFLAGGFGFALRAVRQEQIRAGHGDLAQVTGEEPVVPRGRRAGQGGVGNCAHAATVPSGV